MSATTVFRPHACSSCRQSFYAPTEWQKGQLVFTVDLCPDCDAQGVLLPPTT